jgi:hypothetical protein
MGRNRIPSSIQDAKGAFLHDPQRARTNEPVSDRPIGSPPSSLTPAEKKTWKELVKQVPPGVLRESDRLMFALLVRLASKFYAQEPMAGTETAQMITLSSKFAMNPADRSKVSVETPKASGLSLFLMKKKTA